MSDSKFEFGPKMCKKSLEHLIASESKEDDKDIKDGITRTQKSSSRGSHWLKMGQLEYLKEYGWQWIKRHACQNPWVHNDSLKGKNPTHWSPSEDARKQLFWKLANKRSKHGEGNGNPLQYSCLEKSMDRGAWLAAVHGVTWLSMCAWGWRVTGW